MSALTKPRASSVREVTRDMRPLAAGVKGIRGGLAMCITSGTSKGYFAPADSGKIGVVVGRFYDTGTGEVDNTSGADGDLSMQVHHFRERHVFLLNNDTGTALTAAGREQLCYALDDQTATGAVGNVPAGILYDVDSEGAWVELDAQPENVAGAPPIQSGTSTLISGTKTVTGVSLTATSRIFATMKDPGAGAITGFGALEVPVASRNTGAGSFVVSAIDDSKAVITTAVSTFDWMIVG